MRLCARQASQASQASQARPGQARPGQARPASQPASNRRPARPARVACKQLNLHSSSGSMFFASLCPPARPGQARPGQAGPSQARPGQARPGKPGQSGQPGQPASRSSSDSARSLQGMAIESTTMWRGSIASALRWRGCDYALSCTPPPITKTAFAELAQQPRLRGVRLRALLADILRGVVQDTRGFSFVKFSISPSPVELRARKFAYLVE